MQTSKRKWLLCGLLMMSAACQAVQSSELKTTTAADLVLAGTIKEFTNNDSVDVRAQMQTLQSQVGIQFSQGETLVAAADLTAGLSANVSLAYDSFLELDKFYEAVVSKTKSLGNYYLTYTDAAHVTTQVAVPTRSVAAITAPVANTSISSVTTTVTWDPAQMPSSGHVALEVRASGAVSYFTDIPNTGSFDVDLAWMSGSGTIDLIHVETYDQLPGFAKSKVQMENISRVAVQFAKTASKMSKSLSPAEVVEDTLHECLHHCDVGEDSYFDCDGERYSCCLE